MPLSRLSLIAISFMAFALAACSPASEAEEGPVVLAAASLQEVLQDAADAWAAQGHAEPVLSFAGTQALARQVDAGAPADMLIAADAQWMDWLEERDLIETSSVQVVAANSLAFIRPLDAPENGQIALTGRLAMGDPDAVPAGRYARAALTEMGLWQDVAALIVPTENVRAALALVERGEVDAGIVYASDAKASGRVRVEPVALPLPPGTAIAYPAALVTNSVNAEAGEFLAFLASDEAAPIWCARGFARPEGQPPC